MEINKAKIAEFCRRWGVREFSLFGSAVNGEERPDSDVDVLVDFQPEVRRDMFDLVHMQDELSALFGGREVDIITRRGLERSRNPIRKRGITDSLRQVYVAG